MQFEKIGQAESDTESASQEKMMFADRIWWVTGASSGIGAALARALARAGARVILSGRNVAALEDVAASCSTDTLVLPFEATDFQKLSSKTEVAWAWAESRGSVIHGLVNNAGISQRSLAIDTVFEVYQRIIDVDLLAPIALTQSVLPRMVHAGGGTIVAISSIAGLAGVPLRSAYCAAKHGLIGYHDSLRAETAHLGMHVTVVAPGSVRTQVSRNALDGRAHPRGISDDVIDNGMAPEEAAARILKAVSTGQRELILAEAGEAQLAHLRRSNPDALFDRMEELVQQGYAQRMGVNR